MRTIVTALRRSLGYFLSHVFKDSELIRRIIEAVAFRTQPTKDLEDSFDDYLSYSEIPVFRDRDTSLFKFDYTTALDADILYDQVGVEYDQGHSYSRGKGGLYSVGNMVPRYLTDSLLEPTVIYSLGIDYHVEHNTIIFVADPLYDDRITKENITDDNGVVSVAYQLWGFKIDEDLQAVQRFYGTVMQITAPSSRENKEATELAYKLHAEGSSISLLHQSVSLLANTDYVSHDGTVREIYVEGDRNCVRTDTHIYTAPSSATSLVAIGDSISAGQIIFDSFEIYLGEDELDSSITELTLTSNLLPGFSAPITLPNSQVAITDTAGTYTFPIIAEVDDEILFMANLNTDQPVEVQVQDTCGNFSTNVQYLNFFDEVASVYGEVPDTFNPVDFIRKYQLAPNLVIVKINTAIADERLSCQLIKALHRTYPAGGSLYFL